MKLEHITEVTTHRRLLNRISGRVKKKAPKPGKKLLDRVKSFKSWKEEEEVSDMSDVDRRNVAATQDY